ncbi:hypothetical protein M3P21_12860 [Ruegeria sp. 2012CJ41-6]|uniref:Uncharacterized protein n=1 Tax=Ruegeria spongiae TaxID=2942209 RepID=A0ABT0Q4P0_9RHOB|nr:hypothetical protein [Ruegeria spongiae]MCL6284417.1 hypothetical protein [Ruegeria spongiae]
MKKTDTDFQKFYFEKVATGEGCGCAERIIDVHEFNRLAGSRPRKRAGFPWPSRTGFRRFLQKAGLTSRPSGRDA